MRSRWTMKSLYPPPGSVWFVDLAILPFLRRIELFNFWQPRLVGGTILSGASLGLVSLLSFRMTIPDSLKISLTLLVLFFFAALMLLYVKLPVARKHKEIYRDLSERGVVVDEQGLTIKLDSKPARKVKWQDIQSFHITILESSNNAEFLAFHLADDTFSFPFMQLTRADRLPIPNIISDEGNLYYCYTGSERKAFTPDNNDFYTEMKKRIGQKETNTQLERLRFMCPFCDASIVLVVHNWRLRKLDILFCDQCPNLLSLPQSSQLYQSLYQQYADHGNDTIVEKTDKQVTFRGLVGVEPDTYIFESVHGPLGDVTVKDRRGPAFQQAVELALKPCPCGGHFSYQSLPRCPECNHILKELVNGLGYGRYAVLKEEFPGDKMWHPSYTQEQRL